MLIYLKFFHELISYKENKSINDLSKRSCYKIEFEKLLKSYKGFGIEKLNYSDKKITLKMPREEICYAEFHGFSYTYYLFETIDSRDLDLQLKIYRLSKSIDIKFEINVKKSIHIPNASYTTVTIKKSDIINWALKNNEAAEVFSKGSSEGFCESIMSVANIGTHIAKYLEPVDGVKLSFVNKLSNSYAKSKLLEYDNHYSKR